MNAAVAVAADEIVALIRKDRSHSHRDQDDKIVEAFLAFADPARLTQLKSAVAAATGDCLLKLVASDLDAEHAQRLLEHFAACRDAGGAQRQARV